MLLSFQKSCGGNKNTKEFQMFAEHLDLWQWVLRAGIGMFLFPYSQELNLGLR